MINIEKIHITKSMNRVLAQDVYADRPDPACDISAIDGIAIRYSDRQSGLWLIDHVYLGQNPPEKLNRNECVFVSKGAKVPNNCDLVIPSVLTKKKDGQLFVLDYSGEKVIKVGNNYQSGSLLIPQGSTIDHETLIVLSKNDMCELSVYTKVPSRLCIHSNYICQDNEALKDYRVRDYISPYLISTLSDIYSFDERDVCRLKIEITDRIETQNSNVYYSSFINEDCGFVVDQSDQGINIICSCDEESLKLLVTYLMDPKWFLLIK
ncbi:hypothetical protein MJH12_20020 [bacterium]|nr:hypothetical protein [bacterium]